MATPQRIISSQPTHQSSQAAIDDRHLQRWLWMASVPISLSDWSGSRFVGSFENDLLSPKRLIAFRPGHAVALGVYEFPAMIMHQQDQGIGDNNGTFLDGVAAPSSVFDTGRRERLTRYANPPKLCAYLLMKEYERRGLALFEHLKGLDDEVIESVYEAVIPAEIEAQWAKTKRVVLEQDVRGPFLDQIRDWLGRPGASPMADFAKKKGVSKSIVELVKLTSVELRAACNRGWSFENASLNTSEQQIRRYRNGKLGKEYYDSIDERFSGGPLPLDILCLADTGRQPIDLQQVEAARVMSESTSETMMQGMEVFAERIAAKLADKPTLTAEQVTAIVEKQLKERDAFWQSEIEKLKGAST
jgi:hypothetical protein